MRCDVAIIGAGVSGLSCAAALAARGIESVVLEARNGVGGRIRTYQPPDGGPPLELGSQVIHGARNPTRDLIGAGLAAARPIRSRPVPRDAAARVLLGGRLAPLGALAGGGMPPWAAEQKLAAEREPRAGESAHAADGAGHSAGHSAGHGAADSVAEWLAAQRLSHGQFAATAEWFRQNWAAEPRALSASGVAAARRGDRQVGGGEYMFELGFASLAQELALAARTTILLRRPVLALRWEPGRVTLTVGGGAPVTARAAVITVPPPLVASGRLTITPMPQRKAAAARALPAGDGLCAIAVLASAAPESAVVFDADGRAGFIRAAAGRPEVLVVAKAGAAAAVRATGVPGAVARALPWSAGVQVTSIRIADWGHDPWSAGVFSHPAVGAGWAAPAWAAPVQRTLFFAGEAATAGAVPPSVHGAFGSGLRAAHEIAAEVLR